MQSLESDEPSQELDIALPSGKEPLEELFDKDPMKITSEDCDRIVAYYRSQRHKFLENEAAGKPAPRAKKATAAAKPAPPPLLGLTLDKLDL